MTDPDDTTSQPRAAPRSRFSLRLGRFFGIDVIIHWSFWLLYAYVAFLTLGRGIGVFAEYALLITAVFACVVLHEFGHALTARRFGIGTKDITIFPLGGVARLRGMPDKPLQEILVALAGPAVNVAIAALLLPIIIAVGGMPNVNDLASLSGEFLAQLALINIFLVLFNMIPAFPMDGGRVLRALLALRTGRVEATRAAAKVGQVLAVGFAIGAVYLGNPFLFLIGVFVFFGGRAEAQGEAMRAAFANLTVDNAMMRQFHALHESDLLGHAADELLAGSQHEFPVFDDANTPCGVLTREVLVAALERLGPGEPVGAAMRPSTLVFEQGTPLQKAIEQMSTAGIPIAPVVRGDRVVGLLTLENAGELAALRNAVARRHAG